MPPGAPCHAAGSPPSCPPAPPLSCPPVVSGNPVFFSSVPFIRVTLHGESHGFPINNIGNDNGGSKTSGMTGAESCGPAWVAAGSGPLPEACDVVVRFLPDHTFPSVMPPSPPVLPTGGPFLSAGPPVLPAGFSGNPSSERGGRGRGSAEKVRGGRERGLSCSLSPCGSGPG